MLTMTTFQDDEERCVRGCGRPKNGQRLIHKICILSASSGIKQPNFIIEEGGIEVSVVIARSSHCVNWKCYGDLQEGLAVIWRFLQARISLISLEMWHLTEDLVNKLKPLTFRGVTELTASCFEEVYTDEDVVNILESFPFTTKFDFESLNAMPVELSASFFERPSVHKLTYFCTSQPRNEGPRPVFGLTDINFLALQAAILHLPVTLVSLQGLAVKVELWKKRQCQIEDLNLTITLSHNMSVDGVLTSLDAPGGILVRDDGKELRVMVDIRDFLAASVRFTKSKLPSGFLFA